MNTLEGIQYLTGAEDVTENEAAAILEWCRDWYWDCADCWRDEDGRLVATPETAALLRGCDRHIDGGLAFVLADVRACATAAAARDAFPSSAHASAGLERRLLAGA